MPSTKTLNQSPTIGATENADLLWIWDNSAAELDKISLGNLFTAAYNANQTFALLAGRSGGQTLIGGTAANDDLILEGTSNVTRTTSYVILQPTAGNVGIGTTSPGTKLQVGNASADTNLIRLSVLYGGIRGDRGGIEWHDNTNATGRIFTEFDSSALMSSMHFGSLYNSAYTSTSIMVIRGNGNVGIGTTSPSRKLHVVGTILIDGDESGVAGTIGLTDVNDATLGTGNGTVKLKGTTTRNSAGFIKIYVGTTTAWVPYWTDIS